MPVAAMVAPIAASIGGSLFGANAQAGGYDKAIKTIQDYTNKAIGAYGDYSTKGLDWLQNFYDQQVANQQPYMNVGKDALGQLNSGLQSGAFTMPSFQSPTAEQARNMPGYQFALDQGLQAMNRSAAARGNLLTGGTAKALNNYAQGMADTNYNNLYNQTLNAYQTNAQNLQNRYNQLFGVSGLGENATANLNNNASTMATAGNANLMNTGGEIGNAYQNAAQGISSAYVNKGNAWGQAFGGLGNMASNFAMLQMMNQGDN